MNTLFNDKSVGRTSGNGSRSGGSSSGVYYARVLLKRWRWRCCCAGSCCVAVPLIVGLVAYCAGGAQNAPFFRGGRLSGSTLVDVSEQPTLLASLNRLVEPCHNFYRFVCDGWLRQAGEKLTLVEELALTARRNAATLLRHVEVPVVGEMNAVHKAALLMQKCLLLSRRPPRPEVLLEFMASMGLTWPQTTTMKTSGLISLMVNMSLSWDLNAIFELQLLPTPRAAGGRPRWWLSPSSQLKSWRRERRNLGPEYLTRIRQYVEGFSDARVTRSLVESIFEADDEVLRVTNVYRGGGESGTIDELAEMAPGFQTSAWLDALNNVTRPYFKVRGSDVIAVANVRFLVALQRLLEEVNAQKPNVVPMYLSWYTLRRLAWTVAPDAPELRLSSEPEHEYRCFSAVHELMPLAAGKPFADEAAWDLALIEELFEASKRSYRERIGRSTWMDEAARRFADDKIRLVQGVVPAPELIWNASAFERIYDCVPQSREMFFLPSLLETRRCKQRLLLITAASGQTTAETITWTSPAVYLVRYLDIYNSVAIMGSVLYPPVLQVSGDHRDVFNYAGLAFLFSRLLFGAIDQRGSLRDSTGSPRPWWSNATREGYSRAVRCFEDLYQFDARYIGDDIGAAVATSVAFAAYEQRLRDLYARNSGLWAGLRWLSWPRWLRRARPNEFPDDRAFFMNHCLLLCSRRASRLYSDGWIPAEQKCNLPLKNSPDFWRAFGCREGDAMRAEKSCELI
ncbi:endothelin-converting enzyme 2-like [Dermacentor andersoni]|uniref:endothelin-converting enzyme 2-like n=1 Tax=Dermacentor andersoni TaxID=34620 RepID=UPI003B3A4796